MTCCDHRYGRPSWRPQVSAPATYRSGTPRNQHPVVARWHAHLCGLATATHEISGLIIQYRLPASAKRHKTPGSCFVPSETQESCPVMNLNREMKVHAINFYLKKNDVCTSPSKKACIFHLGSKVSTMRVEQAIN
jgi:hypothetical protein